MRSNDHASTSPDRRDVRVDRRLKEALETGSLPRDLLLVGAAGTGKTFGVLTVLHCLAADYQGLRILICRDTRASLTESVLVTYEQEILPADGLESIAANCLRRVRQSYAYPSGSEIVVGGLDNPGKILSTAWDIIFPNEAIGLTEDAWETLGSRLRRPGRDPRFGYLLGDTNPGDPAHWLKRRVEAGSTVMWDTSHKANPRLYSQGRWTAEGEAYMASLDRLTGARRKRLRDGLWAAGEGAWYKDFDTQTHVSTLAEYDPTLPVHLAVDCGVHTGAVWFQVRQSWNWVDAPDTWEGKLRVERDQVNVFGDYYAFSRPPFNVGHDLLARSGELCGGRVDRACADPTARSATSIGVTVYQEYKRAGLHLESWPLRTVADSLALLESFVCTNPPELLIHPRCAHLLDAFANFKRARTSKGQWLDRPEDECHPYEDLIDPLRGGLCDKYPEGRRHPPRFERRKAGAVL